MKPAETKAHEKFDQFDRNSAKAIDKLMKRTLKTSEEYSRKESTILFGIIGGSFSIPASLIIANYTALSFLVISSPLFAIGIAGGILISRGIKRLRLEKYYANRRFELEKRLDENRLIGEEIIERISFLQKKKAPQHIIERLWEKYDSLVNSNQLMLPETIEKKLVTKTKDLLPDTNEIKNDK